MILTRVNNYLGASLLSLSAAFVGVFIFHLPIWNGPMYGDDFLGVNGALQPNGSTGIWSDIWLAGGGKWRPVSTPIMLWMGRHFEYSYRPYQILNFSLLILCAALVGVLSYHLYKSIFTASTISFAISISHFTWLDQISIYGQMELLAIIFLVSATMSAFLSIELPSNKSSRALQLQLLTTLLLLLSTFTHERYLLTAFCFWLLFLFGSPAGSKLRTRSYLFLIVPAIHIFLKGALMNLDPIAGGGESNLREVRSWWLLQHLGDSFLGLFGYFSGAGKYYSDWPIGELGKQSDLRIIGVLIITVPLLVITLLLLRLQDKPKISFRQKNYRTKCIFQFSLVIATIAPAASVIQRIEPRWLFAPQIFFLLLCTTIISRFNVDKLLKTIAPIILPLCFISISIFYRGKSEAYSLLRDQPSAAILSLEKIAPPEEDWVLLIHQTDANMPVLWQFGYGRVFSQMKNPPYKVYYSAAKGCSEIAIKISCVSIVLKAASMDFDVKLSSPRTK
jgi:hypothetical protein